MTSLENISWSNGKQKKSVPRLIFKPLPPSFLWQVASSGVSRKRKRFDSPIKVYKLPSALSSSTIDTRTGIDSEGLPLKKVPGNKEGSRTLVRKSTEANINSSFSRLAIRECRHRGFVRTIANDYVNVRQHRVSLSSLAIASSRFSAGCLNDYTMCPSFFECFG